MSCFTTTIGVFLIVCSVFSTRHTVALTINEFFPFGLENNDIAMPPADDDSVSVSFTDRFLFYGKSYTSFGVSIDYSSHTSMQDG